MNLILFSNEDYVSDSLVRIKGRRYKHICEILRGKIGQTLKVGCINGPMGEAEIVAMDKKFIDLRVILNQNPPEPREITLILALHRPIVLKRVLLTISSMGIKKIFLIHSSRVEKSFWNSTALQPENIRMQLLLGLEQSCDTMMPEVVLKKRFKAFVEDELPAMIEGKKALLAHPKAKRKMQNVTKKPIVLAIGPEGGFIDYEINKLTDIGFEPFHMGKRILRVETAITAVLGRVYL